MKLIFRGAFIRYADLRKEDESPLFTRIHFTADFSEPVRDAMEWGTPPDGFQSAKLDGYLTATHIILTPNGRELKQHELQMDVTEISDFQFFRVKSDDGESTSTELRFIVRTPLDGAGALIEQYMRHIGKGEAQLRVAYEKQDTLDLEGKGRPPEQEEEDELDTGCVACNTGIPFQDGSDTVHASGVKCTREKEPALAPAVAMGGTHQARKPRLITKEVQ